MDFPKSSQVLGSVKNRIEVFAASHEDFPGMLKKAQQYLVARGKVDRSDGVGMAPLRRADSLGKYHLVETVSGPVCFLNIPAGILKRKQILILI